jgi:hypothetical protein
LSDALSDPILEVLRRELRRLSPDVKIDTEEINSMEQEIIKRDVLEGEKAEEAKRKISRVANRALRKALKEPSVNESTEAPEPTTKDIGG